MVGKSPRSWCSIFWGLGFNLDKIVMKFDDYLHLEFLLLYYSPSKKWYSMVTLNIKIQCRLCQYKMCGLEQVTQPLCVLMYRIEMIVPLTPQGCCGGKWESHIRYSVFPYNFCGSEQWLEEELEQFFHSLKYLDIKEARWYLRQNSSPQHYMCISE